MILIPASLSLHACIFQWCVAAISFIAETATVLLFYDPFVAEVFLVHLLDERSIRMRRILNFVCLKRFSDVMVDRVPPWIPVSSCVSAWSVEVVYSPVPNMPHSV